MVQKININNFIAETFTPAKPATTKIKFVSLSENVEELCNQLPIIENAQAKSLSIKWPFAISDVKKVPILKAHVLAKGNETTGSKHLMEIIFDAKPFADFDMAAGDTVGILPQNSEENVARILKALNLTSEADKFYRQELLASTDKKSALIAHIPTIATPREIIRDCLNLQDVPKKQFLSALSNFTKDEKERAFLSCLSSKEGSAYYNEIIIEKKLNLIDLLELCVTCQPPLELLAHSMQRLLPRPYSIANSLLKRPNEIDIIFSVKPTNAGVTSGMLAKTIYENDISNSCCYMFLRAPTEFRYTEKQLANNQVFICVGTALAPFLGFLEEKEVLSKKFQEVGKTWLFLGATNKQHVIHRERIEQWQEEGILNKYFEALSRDSQHSQYKYVQECMLAHKQELLDFCMQTKTIIYVCADGGEISKAIMKILMELLSETENEGMELLKSWKAKGKLIEHNWW